MLLLILPEQYRDRHHNNARSVAFYNDMGFDSITVPPHGLPVARISAAQAEIRRSK